jgi:hypothetical protein
MKPLLAFLLLASALTVGAQTANVIELTPADQARAQKAWDALQKAQTEWNDVRDSLDDKYVHNGQPWASVGTALGGKVLRQPQPGFENGFEFSSDFRFIVPKVAEPIKTPGAMAVPADWLHRCEGVIGACSN